MFSQMKLGCLPPKHDPRTLKLAKYLAPAQLPTPPASTNWRAKKPGWDMLGNDRAGDCTIACVGHLDEVWAANNGDVQLGYTDQQALAEYAAATGYDPNTGANDNGAAIIDILNRWRQVGIFGNKLGAYASVTMHDHAEVATAIWLFGGVDAGVQLPLAWQGTKLWTTPSHRLRFWQRWQWQPGSWGGHCVSIVDYDAQWLYAVSWGQVVQISWDAWDTFFIEAYACLDSLWTDGTKPAPSGFDIAALNADLQAIGAN
ncbi:MAG: hypothetical protein KGL35_14460 [Bradyrhizobium sp.]|nr:hypothetical protein [Bradyrhizobium sp.]